MKELNIKNFNKLYKDIEELNVDQLEAWTKDGIKVISYNRKQLKYDSTYELAYNESTKAFKAVQHDYYVDVKRDPERMIDIIHDGFINERAIKKGLENGRP